MFARLLYSLLWMLALPLVLLRLVWRGRRQPGYLHHISERFGRYPARGKAPLIWLHAVSVGETRAAQPLIKALRAAWPTHDILITHMTPTGRDTSQALFGDDPHIHRAYLPYDLSWLTKRFLSHYSPRFGLIMETELWPNLLLTCRRQQLPVLLVNARLSDRSAGRYRRWPSLAGMTVGALSAIGAQTPADAARLKAIGAHQVTVTGNIKFDTEAPAEQLALGEQFRQWIGPRPVMLAASTRDGEEALLLDAFLAHAPTDALLILVPRHPQRFDEVATLIHARGLALQRRSDASPLAHETRVWLGDSMGEMFAYYAAAQVALIGGSWLPFGGQNLIEACAVGTPVVIGPHTFNFLEVAEQAVRHGAAVRADTPEQGMQSAARLLTETQTRQQMGSLGRDFAATHRGATQRTLALIHTLSE